ncbi:MAG: toll/interleukin-1 receptor domain-containing protein [Planctomycetota bacterium]|nr:toll/interleukin-1 receptor domain-containing protein [Planctomycetota bacterium]
MPSNALFVSYGHRDMTLMDWLERLKLYLAPLRQKGVVDIWDDSSIKPGSLWRMEIAQALDRANSSILLVGSAFLASDFIATNELPTLLGAAKTRGVSIYPVVVGYCAYKQSVLEQYQAFNDPDAPLEALPTAEQNKTLNDVSIAVDEDLRHAAAAALPAPVPMADTKQALVKIAEELDKTRTAFSAQCRRRNLLVRTIRQRLSVADKLQYENFFFRYYSELNREELFQFEQIRAITEGSLHDGNEAILGLIENNPQVLEAVPSLADLRQHIVFWLNKYDKVFVKRQEMCLLYTGVEDRVPFPDHAHEDVDTWLESHN